MKYENQKHLTKICWKASNCIELGNAARALLVPANAKVFYFGARDGIFVQSLF